ncbi:MAG: glycosyltransferase family protein [Bosea sp. (in: a-proteobacteria)]
MRPQPRALFYLQHLLGIGHVIRGERIAAALCNAGVDVTLALGGMPTAVMADHGKAETPWRSVQLEPVRVESGAMGKLLGADGEPFDEARKAARRDALLMLLDDVRPDILIIEAFPFGRRQMRFELEPLLDRAKAMGVPVIASSIRDILQESVKPGRAEETCAAITRWFDLVLVHGEEAVTPLSMTFPLADRFAAKTRYTGMVGPSLPADRSHAESTGLIISVGGGAVGGAVLKSALAALNQPALAHLSALALTGPNLPGAELAGLQAMARPGIMLERFVNDLPARMGQARLSISQAGYNTVADLIVSGCPAVLVPYAAGGETEQARRAAALAEAGRAIVIAEDQLNEARMTAAIMAALDLPRHAPSTALGGAGTTARLLLEALSGRR